MKVLNSILVAAVLLFSSCNKKDDSEPQPSKFTFIVGQNYISDIQKAWVAVYNSDGSIVKIAELNNNFKVEVPVSNAAEKYMVQLIQSISSSYEDGQSVNYMDIDLYNWIKPCSWILNNEEHKPYSPIGNETIRLKGIQLDECSNYGASNKGVVANTMFFNDSVVLEQKHNPDNIYFWLSKDNESYFKWIENAPLNYSIDLTISDMQKMNNSVNYKNNSNIQEWIWVCSYDNPYSNPIEKHEIFNGVVEPKSNLNLYYPLELFNRYYSYITRYSQNSYESQIKSSSTPPESLGSLDAEIEISNKSLSEFKASISGTCDVAEFGWNGNNEITNNFISLRYNIIGDINSFKNFILPKTPYSSIGWDTTLLSLSQINCNEASIYDFSQFENYEAYVNNLVTNTNSDQNKDFEIRFKLNFLEANSDRIIKKLNPAMVGEVLKKYEIYPIKSDD